MFTLTKKKILQNFLSRNEQKVTSNEQRAKSFTSNSVRLKYNIWKKYLTGQHYIQVCSFYIQKAKLTTLLNNWLVVWVVCLFKMNIWPQIKLFLGLLILLTIWERVIFNGKTMILTQRWLLSVTWKHTFK